MVLILHGHIFNNGIHDLELEIGVGALEHFEHVKGFLWRIKSDHRIK